MYFCLRFLFFDFKCPIKTKVKLSYRTVEKSAFTYELNYVNSVNAFSDYF